MGYADKSEKRKFITNAGASWLSFFTNVATGIVLSPFILHRLGDEAFGLWVLIYSISGYYGLFDLGIRSSVVRFVAKYSAKGEREEMLRLLNTSLLSYSCVGVVLLLITAGGSLFVNRMFHVTPSYQGTAPILFILVGTSLAVGFPFGVFTGTLEGLQKFHLINLVNIATTLLRTILIIVLLGRGYGLITVALITVTLPLVNGLVYAIAVFRATGLRLAARYIRRDTLREIFNYSSVTFLISVAGRLRFKTDAIIIGTFLPAAEITYFSIGSRMVDYATDAVTPLAQLFVPMSSHSDAKGDRSRLRQILIAGNRACAFVMFPIAVTLVLLGKSLIEVWVGARYIDHSYPIILILLLPTTLFMAQAASGRILYGMGKHRTWAFVVLAEGIANVTLSVLLVRHHGINGDALGTAIPLFLSCTLFLPAHLCHLLQVRIRDFITQAFLLPFLLCLPLIATFLAMRHWFVAHTLLQLLAHLTAGGIVFGSGLAWAIYTRRVFEVSPRQQTPRDEATLALIETYQEEA
jgi:O-antigen/teichoic acid export membrane protein